MQSYFKTLFQLPIINEKKSCVTQNIASLHPTSPRPTSSTVNLPTPRICYLTWPKRLWLYTLKQRLSSWAQSNYWLVILGEAFQVVVRERDMIIEAGSERCYIAGSEDGKRRPQAKEWGWTVEAGKVRNWISPVNPSERSPARMILWF